MGKAYDLVIIGAGPGGYVMTKKAAKMGMSVVIIDKGKVGELVLTEAAFRQKHWFMQQLYTGK